MSGNAITIAVSVTGSGQAASGLGNVVKGLLSVGSAMMIIRKGLKYVTDASDLFKSWESAMASANQQMRLGSGDLSILSQRLLAVSGPLQSVTDLYEQAPDAMGRMASAGEDNIHMLEDLNDIAILSAVTHTKLGDTADTTMGIMRSYGMANGEAGRATRILAGAGQEVVGTFEEVTGALRDLAPVFNVTEEEAETTAAALATMTKAGFSASASGAALRIGWGKMQTEETRDKLAKLGITVTDFAGTMQQIKDKGLTEKDWAGILGVRQYAQFAGMIAHWDEFGTILETIKTADPAGMFDAFAATAEAAGVRIENEFNRRLIAIGAAIEPARRELTILTKQLEVMGTELAAWVIKHKENAIAVAAAILLVSQAIKGTLMKTPLGAALIVLETLIALSSAAANAFKENTRAELDMTNALQASVEKSIALVQTTREQVEAELEAAKARKAGLRVVADLAVELGNLRAEEADLVGLQMGLSRSATQLENALTAEKLAMDLTKNAAFELFGVTVAGARKGLADAIKSWQAGLTTVEKINEATKDLTHLQSALVGAGGDEAKIREVSVNFLRDTLKVREDELQKILDCVDAGQIGAALTEGMNALLENQKGILADNKAVLLDTLQADYLRMGILDQIKAAREGTLDLSERELEVLIGQVHAEKAKLWAIEGQARAMAADPRLAIQKAGAAVYEIARVQRMEVEEQLKLLESYRNRGAGTMPGEYEPAGAGVAGAAGAEKLKEQMTPEEYLTAEREYNAQKWIAYGEEAQAEENDRKAREQRVRDFMGTLTEEERGAATAAAAAAAAEYETHMKNVAGDLGGIFQGVFTDASWNAADSFKNFYMKALDDLLQYALDNGLFALLGGEFGGMGGGGFFGEIFKLLGFAEGGYVNRPTLAMMGERGPEFAIPQADMFGAVAGGIGAVENLLYRLSGQPVRGPVPSGAQAGALSAPVYNTTNQFYAPMIGSLGKLTEAAQKADALNRRGRL